MYGWTYYIKGELSQGCAGCFCGAGAENKAVTAGDSGAFQYVS